MSDGWIGDAAHASRTSDHNPWVKDGSTGVVTAIDITNDPTHGVDGEILSRALIKDPRVKYVIWNREIYDQTVAKKWRPYVGKNPHNHHVHVSVLPKKAIYDDTKQWEVGTPQPVPPPTPAPLPVLERPKPVLRLEAQGGDVFGLQRLLGVKVDGDFGPKTLAAVKAFQKRQGIVVDGVVGAYTWEALEKEKTPAAPTAAPMMASSMAAPTERTFARGTPGWAVDELRSLGWSKDVALSLVANLIWESGGHTKIEWDAVGDNGNSKGAGQWNNRHGRSQALDAFAKARNTTWEDPATQLRFADLELRTTERSVGNRLAEAETFSDAMDIALDFWRPGTPHADKRRAIGEKLKEKYDAASRPVDPGAGSNTA